MGRGCILYLLAIVRHILSKFDSSSSHSVPDIGAHTDK